MPFFLISYDLDTSEPEADHNRLRAAIVEVGPSNSYHLLESVWVVETPSGVTEGGILAQLQGCLHAKDRLVILNLDGRGQASSGLDALATSWLRSNRGRTTG